jgi:uncharacterized LabA/DUF88 family protein
MKKVFFFVDGFNFYHSIDLPALRKYKWLNYYKLATILARKDEEILKVILFTAYAEWDEAKVERHKILIRALGSAGVDIVLGRFKTKQVKCRLCYKIFNTWTEKQTDVNIAVNLIRYAILGSYDKAYIISGDTDLIPAIKAFRELFPEKEVCIVFPFSRKGDELKSVCNFHMKIKPGHLEACLLPDPMILKDGTQLLRPESWR